ncbi:UxaA family hydrolase [Anoxynatronum buryatiense]|uniref:Altronate dehydratase small subunit n=1 Tax=Anoxynatronum buryatiense TaxID=489973 RepID=A0AA45WW90_9CLOT|nr:UxaA family hydrolase [Anoxynatronum buryatiense]SMP58112.1 altronate dehydratase small subunit [Anoxynatronum buryatiense]
MKQSTEDAREVVKEAENLSNPEAFVIDPADNVATALGEISPGPVPLTGLPPGTQATLEAVEVIPPGHKIALKPLAAETPIVKYGVVIGCTTIPVEQGAWVHLHCMRSLYDERSSHLDAHTGAPKDTRYE